jgi:hypothetical protein
MAWTSYKTSFSNKQYLVSNSWKCDKSPEGAHHWMIDHKQMSCRYCNDSRQVDNTGPALPVPLIE